jgi:hypothetical protein
MSYCRFGADSDVYVVGYDGGFECINCRSVKGNQRSWYGDDHGELFHHLLVDHLAKGHMVPDAAMDRIVMEQTTIANDAHNAQSIEILSILLFKLTLTNTVFNHLAHAGHVVEEMEVDFWTIIDDLENLNWPEDD